MNLIDFKCPNCAGSVRFKDDETIAVCNYCGEELHFQKEIDKLQDENSAGIQELTDRIYDLIRQENYIQVKKAANEGLITYPYAGRLHLCLLLAELNLKKPSLLGSVGINYTTSINFQNCMRYMTTEDKKDLLFLVNQNSTTVGKPAPQPVQPVQPVITQTPEVSAPINYTAPVQSQPYVQQQPAPATPLPTYTKPEVNDAVQNTSQVTSKVKTKAPKKKISTFFKVALSGVFALSAILFTIFVILAANGFGGANTLLIITGVIDLVIAIILGFVIIKRKQYVCPVCGKTRKHHREFIRQEEVWNNTKNDYIIVNTYLDSFICPDCGETMTEQVQKKNEDRIREF